MPFKTTAKRKAYLRERQKDPEFRKRHLENCLMLRLGLTRAVAQELRARTRCDICRCKFGDGPRSKFVDHDHRTGKVRGVLCNNCNTGLGKLGDTVESIGRALEYLRNA